MALETGEKTLIDFATEGLPISLLCQNKRKNEVDIFHFSGSYDDVERSLRNHVPVDVHDEVNQISRLLFIGFIFLFC